jgi:hypothetical protein
VEVATGFEDLGALILAKQQNTFERKDLESF